MKDGSAFLDSNVLMYLYSTLEKEKRYKSIALFMQYTCITSTQAMNEFCNVCLYKYKIHHDRIAKDVDGIESTCKVEKIDTRVINDALRINARYQYSYYDSLMIASALASNCVYLFSEDMQHQQIIDNRLAIINPYNPQ